MERQRHAWSGMAKRGVRVGGVGGEKLLQGGSNLPAKYGRGLTGVKIEKWELGETLEKLLAKETFRFVNLVAEIKEPWDQC